MLILLIQLKSLAYEPAVVAADPEVVAAATQLLQLEEERFRIGVISHGYRRVDISSHPGFDACALTASPPMRA